MTAAANGLSRSLTLSGPVNIIILASVILRTGCPVPKKILIVEQQLEGCVTLAAQLEGRGFEALCAADGRECLEMAEREPPEAIAIDLDTPDLDGVELVKLLRGNGRLSSTPVIVVASHGDGRVFLAMKAGADGVAHKPVQLDTFTDLLEQLLSNPSPRRRRHP